MKRMYSNNLKDYVTNIITIIRIVSNVFIIVFMYFYIVSVISYTFLLLFYFVSILKLPFLSMILNCIISYTYSI